ncbi:MAG: helix-turn-helix transcriptional regulator [Aridibacter sp.]
MSKKVKKPQNADKRIHLRPLIHLSKIHRLIVSESYPNIKKIASDLELSERTIKRYIAQMRDEFNAPIKYSRKKKGFHYTHPNWEMPLVPLTEGELLAFFIATVALQGKGETYEDERLRRAIGKIASGLPEQISVELGYLFESTSFQSPPHVIAEGGLLDRLHKTVTERETIEFDYYIQYKDKSERRNVNPLHLTNHEGTWYAISYDNKRQGVRDFHTARISNLKTTGKFFELPSDWNKEEYLNSGFGMYRGGKLTEVEIVFDEYQSKWMRERNNYHPQETREELPDGRMKLKFTVGENGLEAVARFCLQHAGHCQVIKPKKLIEIIKEKLQRGLDLHK